MTLGILSSLFQEIVAARRFSILLTGAAVGVLAWILESTGGVVRELAVRRRIERWAEVGDANVREVWKTAEELWPGCARLKVIEPYEWHQSMGMPLGTMDSSPYGLTLVARVGAPYESGLLRERDPWGAVVLWDEKDNLIGVVPVPGIRIDFFQEPVTKAGLGWGHGGGKRVIATIHDGRRMRFRWPGS